MKKVLCAVLVAMFIGGLVGCKKAEVTTPADNATKAAPAAPATK